MIFLSLLQSKGGLKDKASKIFEMAPEGIGWTHMVPCQNTKV